MPFPTMIAAPPGYLVRRSRDALLFGRADVVDAVLEAVGGTGSLFAYAASHPAARRLSGRGPVFVVPLGGEQLVVRHNRRGGAVAKYLGDRHLRRGEPRPLAELKASVEARRRGIATPAVLAASVHPAGPMFYRGDVATEYVPHSRDLAELVFQPAPEPAPDAPPLPAAADAARAAGRLVRRIHDRGMIHPDLNLKNILVRPAAPTTRPEALVLDLDRCRMVASAGRRRRERMLRRFERSWRGLERRTGRDATAALEAFHEGYAEAPEAREAAEAEDPARRGAGRG